MRLRMLHLAAGVVVAAVGAFFLVGSISGRPVAALSVVPSPTPCLLALTCPPSPLPVVSSNPLQASNHPASTPAQQSAPTGSTASHKTAPAPAANGEPTDAAVLESVLGDAALARSLAEVEQQPLTAERPDLVHFIVPAGATRAAGTAPAPVAVPLILLLCAALVLPLRLARPKLRLGPSWLALALLGLAVAGASTASLPAQPVPERPAAVPSRVLATGGPSHSARRTAPAAEQQAWTRLLAIELRLSRQHATLAEQENRLYRIAADIESGTARPRVRAVAQLMQQHDAEAAAYQATLEQEYQLYLAAASQGQVAEDLRVGSAANPAAAQAVTTDLQRITTQLQQEQTIAASLGRLQQQGQLPGQASSVGTSKGFGVPVTGSVAQPFGPTNFSVEPPLIYQGRFYPHFHTGLDIAAPAMTPVGASADGVVALVASSTDGHGHLTGYGNYIVVAHAHGYFTLYAHLTAALVTAGQLVHQGQTIGLAGSTGNSTGPHLHFEIRRDGEFLDPLPYLLGTQKPW
ncbi:MAG TPA: peptidoglycan DD-metalloendopeptidase family protein [Candidatus Dormibacteraeota bacterium]